MPSLTTGELVTVLQEKNAAKLRDIEDPAVLVFKIRQFLERNKDIPAGVTIAAISDALEDMASREFGAKRSACWAKARKAHLKRQPECQACGQTSFLSVHHAVPYHLRPDLECDPSNLITLCEKSERFGFGCHLIIGHCGRWSYNNPNVFRSVEVVRATWEKSNAQID